MIRIIVDSQSNRLFKGVLLEQNYDQRGGLCQVGHNDIVITTNPIDPNYLDYWNGIGFSIPHLLIAGPFDSRFTLSELIMRNNKVQEELKNIIGQNEARLEFFCIEETERKLSEILGIQSYCNFDVSILLSRKYAFKKVCESIGLPTAPWTFCKNGLDLSEKGKDFLINEGKSLVKTNDGTGGISCGGMFKIENERDLARIVQGVKSDSEYFILEKIINSKVDDISLHWEIDSKGNLRSVKFFNQLSENFGYSGASYPVKDNGIVSTIEMQLREKMYPFLKQHKAIGYFCCDIVVDTMGGIYWIDFNPRKGAIIYVYDMAQRIARIVFNNKPIHFWHQHFRYSNNNSFSLKEVLQKLKLVIMPNKDGFVVITNPGVISFGYIDITAISPNSIGEARALFQKAVERL